MIYQVKLHKSLLNIASVLVLAAIIFILPILSQLTVRADTIPLEISNRSEIKELIRLCNQRNVTQSCNCPCRPVPSVIPAGFTTPQNYNLWWCNKDQRNVTCDKNIAVGNDRVNISPAGVITLKIVDGQDVTMQTQAGGNTSGILPLAAGGGVLVYNDRGQLDFGATIPRLVTIVLMFAAFVAAFLVIQGGFTYINSQGNDEEVKKGTQTMLMAVLGLIIILLSIAVVEVASGALGLGVRGIDEVIDGAPRGIDRDKEIFNPSNP